MITTEQFKEAIKKGDGLFSINENFTISKIAPKMFVIEAWDYISGGQYPRVVITDIVNREYSPDNVFATEAEAKEEAKRQLTKRLAELNRMEVME